MEKVAHAEPGHAPHERSAGRPQLAQQPDGLGWVIFDANIEARYTVTSVGGRKAMHALAIKIADQMDKDPSRPVPVVRLGNDYYQHKSYGRVYTPVFDVLEWVSLDGSDAAPAEAPTTRRRRG
mgnify:CR=1 FL=1